MKIPPFFQGMLHVSAFMVLAIGLVAAGRLIINPEPAIHFLRDEAKCDLRVGERVFILGYSGAPLSDGTIVEFSQDHRFGTDILDSSRKA